MKIPGDLTYYQNYRACEIKVVWDKCRYQFGKKVYYNQILPPFLNFQILQYLTSKKFFKFFGKVKIINAPAGFELMTCRFVVFALIYCPAL